jgi:HEAT repeat protein
MKVDQPANVLNAAYLVLRITGSQGEAAIVSGVRHEDTRHRLAAVKALENDYSRNTYAVPALIEVLGDSDPKIRRTAAHALEHIALATEPEFKNDGHAIHIRPEGEIGPTTKAVVPALCRLLKDSDSNVRCEAVESLARMGKSAKASIPDLITFVETAFSKVKTELANHARRGAEVELECGVEALERMGPAASAAVPLLTAIKELNLLNVIRAAEKALDSIQPQRNPGRRQGRGSNPAGATKVPDHDRGYTT